MCCIIHRPKDSKVILESNITQIITANPDGWGVSYFKEGILQVIRSMEMEKALDQIRELEKDNVEFIFHSRFATHGEKAIKNCHPYKLNKGVLFHNGTVNVYCRNKSLSDTYHFSQKVNKFLNKGRPFDWIMNKFSTNVGRSRFALMLNTGEIIKHGTWHEIDGCFYSKLGWRWSKVFNEDYWHDYNSNCYTESYKPSIGYVKKNSFDQALANCEQGIMLYRYLVKDLTENELILLAQEFPSTCAEYLLRTAPC